MVLVRLAYAADLPSPEEALKRLTSAPGESSGSPAPRGGGGGSSGASAALRSAPRLAATQPASAPEAKGESAPTLVLNSFAELVALAGTQRDIQLKTALERDVRLVRFEQGVLEFSLAPRRFAASGGATDAQVAGLDRPALDGRAFHRARNRHPCRTGRNEGKGAAHWGAGRILWCARRSTSFPAPSSSPCAAARWSQSGA